MDREFERLFTERLRELTRDLRSYHLPSKTMRPPEIYTGMIPLHEGEWREGEFFPHLCWCYTQGGIGLKPHPFTVLVEAGMRVDTEAGTLVEQIRRGTAACADLVEAMRGLCARHVFGAYKLTLPFSFRIGDRAEGLDGLGEGYQPHPYYRARFDLQFIPR